MDNIEVYLSSIITDLDYKIDWRSKALRPGKHKSKVRGSGFEFKDVLPITEAEKFDKLDILATVQSFDGIPRVRIVEQKSNIKIILIVDLSASLSWNGIDSKKMEMTKLACVLGYSAYRSGDEFGSIGYSSKIEFFQKAEFAKSAGLSTGKNIWKSAMSGLDHEGLKVISNLLPQDRSLIFWFSDFYFPESVIEEFLSTVSGHNVLAVSFRDNAEINMPNFGLCRVVDSETGKLRSVFLRPGIKRKMITASAERENRLLSLFESHGSHIYFNKGEADLEQFQDWLLC